MHQLLSATSADRYVEAMRETVDRLAGRLRDTSQPFSGASRAQLQELVDAVDLDADGLGTRSALREADDLVGEHAVWFHHPAYAAHLNCPVAVPAVVAEAIIAAVNPSLDTYDQSTIGTLMERKLVDWTCGRIGFAAGDGVFTSGGTQSNLQALLLARETAIAARCRGARRADGAAPARHRRHRVEPLQRAEVRAPAGARRRRGRARARPTPAAGWTRPRWRRPSTRSRRSTGWPCASSRPPAPPTAAASTRSPPIADECDRAGVWLHVDAAYGCGLLVSPTRRHLLDGIERARSVTVDFHKSFFQPVSSSAVLVRGRSDLRHVTWHADYLNPRETPRSRTRSTSRCRRPAGSTRSSSGRRCARWAPTGSASCSTRCSTWPRGCTTRSTRDVDLELVGRTELSTVLFRVPAGRRHRRAGRPPGAAGPARAVRVGPRAPSPRPSSTGGRASSSRCSTPRRRSTTCARCSTWSAARVRRWSRATTWSTCSAEVGARDCPTRRPRRRRHRHRAVQPGARLP